MRDSNLHKLPLTRQKSIRNYDWSSSGLIQFQERWRRRWRAYDRSSAAGSLPIVTGQSLDLRVSLSLAYRKLRQVISISVQDGGLGESNPEMIN